MKVRITRLHFDGFKRHRAGTVLNISDKKYMKESEIPKSSNKKVGDVIAFAPSCMEFVDAQTAVKDVPRPRIIDKKSLDEQIVEQPSDKEVI